MTVTKMVPCPRSLKATPSPLRITQRCVKPSAAATNSLSLITGPRKLGPRETELSLNSFERGTRQGKPRRLLGCHRRQSETSNWRSCERSRKSAKTDSCGKFRLSPYDFVSEPQPEHSTSSQVKGRNGRVQAARKTAESRRQYGGRPATGPRKP